MHHQGTPYFMAVEIMKQIAFLKPQRATIGEPIPTLDTLLLHVPALDTEQHVVHNFQHNLESVWWILVWILTARTGNTSEACKQFVQQVFVVSMVVSKERETCIVHGPQWQAIMLEQFQKHLSPILSKLQEKMYEAYCGRPKITNLNHAAVLNLFSEIHVFFDVSFSSLLHLQNSGWGLIPLLKPTILEKPGQKKRVRLPHTSSKSNGHEYVPPSSDEEDVRSDSPSEQHSRPGKKKRLTC